MTTDHAESMARTIKVINETIRAKTGILRLLTGQETYPCPTFSPIEDDPDRCKHCRYVEYAHIDRVSAEEIIDRLVDVLTTEPRPNSAREDFEIALTDYVYDVSHGYRLCIPESRKRLNDAIDALILSGHRQRTTDESR